MYLLILHLKDGTTNPVTSDRVEEFMPFMSAWTTRVNVTWTFVGSNGITTKWHLDDIERITLTR